MLNGIVSPRPKVTSSMSLSTAYNNPGRMPGFAGHPESIWIIAGSSPYFFTQAIMNPIRTSPTFLETGGPECSAASSGVPQQSGIRGAFSAAFLAIAILVSFTAPEAAAGTAKGVVFHDITGTGKLEADDPPVAGVAVSNGRDIVITDGRGRYELPMEEDTVIFVIKPRGWTTPVDEAQIPQFHYLHSPGGAAGDAYAGLEPTGAAPESIDFPLYPQEEPEQFEVLVFGDTQPRNLEEIYYLAHDSLHELDDVDTVFGVTLGDIVFDNLELFEDLNSAVATVGIPWRHVIGNHDLDFTASAHESLRGTYRRVYGPNHYSFAYGPAHFIAVDNIRWQGEHDTRSYRTGLGEEQMTFIRNELARIPGDRLVVFMAHIPWIGSTPWADEDERDEFFGLLQDRPRAISLVSHAHQHYHEFIGEDYGWPEEFSHHMVVVGASCGSWWRGAPDEYGIPHSMMRCGTPTGYAFLSIDGSDWNLRYQAARKPADFQMHLHAPDTVASGAEETKVFANVFNALPDAKVRMRIGGEGKWRSMQQVTEPDPFFEAAREREEALPDSPWLGMPGLRPSRHLWMANLPTGLAPGFHAIDVRAEDDWAVYKGRRLIRIH